MKKSLIFLIGVTSLTTYANSFCVGKYVARDFGKKYEARCSDFTDDKYVSNYKKEKVIKELKDSGYDLIKSFKVDKGAVIDDDIDVFSMDTSYDKEKLLLIHRSVSQRNVEYVKVYEKRSITRYHAVQGTPTDLTHLESVMKDFKATELDNVKGSTRNTNYVLSRFYIVKTN